MNWIEHRCDMSPSFFCCDLIWCDDVRIRAKNHNSKPKAHTWISRRAKRLIGLDYKNAKCPSERNSNQNRRVKNNSKQMAIERQRNEQRIDGSVLICKLFFCCYDWFLSERTKKMQLLLFHWRIHFFSQSDFFAVVPFYSFSLLCLLVSLFSTFVLESVVCNALFTRKKQLRSNEVKRTTSKTTVHQMRNWGPKKKSSNFIWCETHQIHKELTHNGQTADWRLTYSKESLVVAAHHFSFTIRLVPNFP